MLADNSLQLSEQAFFVSKHTPPPTPPKLQPSLSVNCVYLLLPFWKRQVATREFFPLSCSGCIGVPGDSALPDILIWQRPGQEPFLEGSVDRALGTVLGLALSLGGSVGGIWGTLLSEELGELSFGSATNKPCVPGASRGPPLGLSFPLLTWIGWTLGSQDRPHESAPNKRWPEAAKVGAEEPWMTLEMFSRFITWWQSIGWLCHPTPRVIFGGDAWVGPCSFHFQPWGGAGRHVQLAVSPSCLGLSHLLLRPAGGVGAEPQPNLLSRTSRSAESTPFSPHSVLCSSTLLGYPSPWSCFVPAARTPRRTLAVFLFTRCVCFAL